MDGMWGTSEPCPATAWRRVRGLLIWALAAGAFAGCCTHKTGGGVDSSSVEPYVRVAETGSNIVKLQIAAREFAPARGRGPVVWLTGVSHVGDPGYYKALQRHLDKQSLVLFEGISDRAHPSANGGAHAMTSPEGVSSAGDHSSLQSSLAASMGLVFQLNAIDYDRPNFRNSDLSIPQLRELLANGAPAQQETAAGERFEGVLQMMQGGSLFDSLLQFGLRFLGTSSKFQALGRLALIEVIGDIQGDLARLQGLPPDMKQMLEVLLQRRNAQVLADLRMEMGRVGRKGSIAVFYGTGHMPDLEKHLRQDLRYRPSGQLWFTAFDVDLAKSGVTDSERQFLRSLIQQQLKQLRR